MSEIYFDNAADIGTLYLEHIFYEFESEPILFMCTDDMKNMYLCLCSEIRHVQKWILVPCSILQLKSLIEEEKDILSVFLSAKRAVVITMDLQGNESSCIVDTGSVDRLDLPEEGTFIRCDKNKARSYLWKKQYELLCGQIKEIRKAMAALDESVSSYRSVLNNSIVIKRQTEIYKDSVSKEFFQQTDMSEPEFHESVTAGYQYSLDKNKPYYFSVESMEIDNSGSHDSLEAA